MQMKVTLGRNTVKQSILCLTVICLFLIGCSGPRGPWIKTDHEGPWSGADERAEIVMRKYYNQFKSTHMLSYLRDRSLARPIWVHDLGKEFSLNYFTRTDFWLQWPDAGSSSTITFDPIEPDGVRNIPDKKVPYRFYLVSISPTVIVGVSKEGDRFVPPKYGYLHPLAIKFYGLVYGEYVWIMTKLPASPEARLVYFAPELSMELEALPLASGSAAISLGDGSQLTFSREKTSINIVRETQSTAR